MMQLWVFFLVTLALGSESCCPPPSPPLRTPRYADAIFSNGYRKVLSQLSARKLLQDILSRRQGERSQEPGAKARLGRAVDHMWATQEQVVPDSILRALLRERRNSQG